MKGMEMSWKKVGTAASIVAAVFGGAGNAEQQGARAQRVQETNRRASITREVNRNNSIQKFGRGKK